MRNNLAASTGLTFAISFVILFASAALSAGAPAQEADKVAVGDFKQLDFRSRLKIGTDYLLSPDLAKRTMILYAYKPENLKDPRTVTAAYNQVLAGNATVAIPKGNGQYRVIESEDAIKEGLIQPDNPNEFDQAFERGMLIVTFPLREFVGVFSGEPLVSFNPVIHDKARDLRAVPERTLR